MLTSLLVLGGVRTTTPVVPRLVPVGVEEIVKPAETGTGGGDELAEKKIRWGPKQAAVVT